ncbi:MAG: N-acetylmuramoyl-L-alanine amidase [Bacteriovoracaceae bacterium]|nr:N-acetylmuramoyl-L-alanine amidase [Bacteriovoracaceae bacterium]
MKSLILTLLYIFSCATSAYTILIDPGHGGEDEGARARYYFAKKKWRLIKEKDIALSLAKMIHEELGKKNFNTYLTRSVDRTVTLAERAEIAEKIKADLFISVHINSSEGNAPRGFETYYLDNHEDSAIKKVEQVENKDLTGKELIVNKILTDLVIERTVKSSKGLASSIHSNIQVLVGKRYKLIDRGVKPGLFYVLALTKRPGILLEVGFLSNSRELMKLLDEKFQRRYAVAVAKGISDYIKMQNKFEPALL